MLINSKTLEDVEILVKSAAGAVVVESISVKNRANQILDLGIGFIKSVSFRLTHMGCRMEAFLL